LVGCGATAPTTGAPTTSGDPLSHCAETAEESDVRSWSCGELTAVEAIVASASDDDVKHAIDGFAARFPGTSPRRVDSIWAVGDSRHTWVRLEGTSNRGEPVEAQMVAVESGPSVRMVTCSTHGSDQSCGPVVARLVHGVD